MYQQVLTNAPPPPPDFKEWGYLGSKMVDDRRIIWLMDNNDYIHVGYFLDEKKDHRKGVYYSDVYVYVEFVV